MKNSISILLVLFACICAWSCQTDDTTIGESTSQLAIALPETRTSLGNKSGDTYPVYWSEGDCIVVNGVKSKEAVINEANPNSAIFDFGSILNYPLNIVYPYTSTTTAEAPKVVIPTVQHYTEGTFEPGSAPMCGYTAKASQQIELKHLVGVVKFPVMSNNANITLEKIVITATNGTKLSGEFDVNCSEGTIVASENSSKSITYTLPENFVLSADNASDFFITIASGNLGKCIVDFIEPSGDKMSCSWNASNVKVGIVREFKNITYKRGTNCTLTPLATEEDDFNDDFHTEIGGYIKDSNGNAIAGVAVSDGFQITTTNSNGYYNLKGVTKDCRYIYISIPAEYEVPINEFGQPCFYKAYTRGVNIYNFTLTPLAGGKEQKFALVAMADPQVLEGYRYDHFVNEALPGIRKHCQEFVASTGIPCYGITLGDLISNSNKNDASELRDDMRDHFSVSSIGIPVFQVMGNHDNTYFNKTKPLTTDERSSTIPLAAQRAHEDMFGPVNYSFDRGDIHIVAMQSILYNSNVAPSSYDKGFTDSQLEWLKQDLALVDKSKTVILCVHTPLFNKAEYQGTADDHNKLDVLALLNDFSKAHILSGHTHINQMDWEYKYVEKALGINTPKYPNVIEHNIGAICGSWWKTNMCGDGSPCGFAVFFGEGNSLTDWYYTGYHEGMNTREHQMRLYRGNAITGAEIEGDNPYGTKGYYAFNFDEDDLLANVYFADREWYVGVFEDGVFSGFMELIDRNERPQHGNANLIGSGAIDNPFMSSVAISSDMYFTGLILGVEGYEDNDDGGICQPCRHLYKYKLKNKDADIMVVAVDRFGNEYTETKITEGTDYSLTRMAQ